MHDFLFYIISGALVGVAVGLTGVGGGSLMTPILLLLNIPANIAVGTDLLYAAGTKAVGVHLHHKKKNVHWPVALTMLAGSLPASGITIIALQYFFIEPQTYQSILTSTLGIMLLVTGLLILFKKAKPEKELTTSQPQALKIKTLLMGVLLGVLVTLSSVGAGVCGTAILFSLYPRLKGIEIVGTDIAHAVPLTLIAGLGHLYLGNVDLTLLGGLIIGSVPAMLLGTHLGAKLPDVWMRKFLAIILLGMGIRYSFL